MNTIAKAPNAELSRRTLLKALGGGILTIAWIPDSWAEGIFQRGQPLPQVIAAWVHIGNDGKVTVFSGKAEVGQNVRTSITQGVAEELHVPVSSITVVLGDTDLVPYDMGTFGSRSTPTMLPQVRRAAASARETLVKLASARWHVDPTTCHASNGKVTGPGGLTLSYGEIATSQPIDGPIAKDVALTSAADWKVLGTSVPKVDAVQMVTGRHKYSADMALPGMLHVKVLRAPSFGAKLASFDDSDAKKIAGVRIVRDGGFVAVAAPRVRQAELGLQALKATWTEVPSSASSKDLEKVLRPNPVPSPQTKGLKATYTCAYIAHVPLEPRAALADWRDGKMTVWTGSQRPFGVKTQVADALGVPADKVHAIVPDTGSGYGGKHTAEAAIEAARVSKALGEPAKLVWTRQEEFTHAYFRPGGVVDVEADAGGGKIARWNFQNYNSGGSGLETPYDVASPVEAAHEVQSPLRQGSYRSLASCFNHFARESAMDELAHQQNIDPLEFRIKNLKEARLAHVLQVAADKFGWKPGPAPKDHGYGLACGTEKGSYIATVVEVAIDPETKAISVVRAVSAFECGAIVNPDHLKNQVEGAVIMGLGGALWEEIQFENNRILNPHLAKYRVPRYSDIPILETTLVDRRDLPSAGAGETPIVAVAPAIGNAVFAATGVRLRSMPMRLPSPD